MKETRMTAPRIALGGFGLLVASAAFWVGSGIVGVLAAGVTVVLWYLTPARYALTFGQVALASLVSTSSPLVVAVGECGLLVLLLDSLVAVGVSGGFRNTIPVGVGYITIAAGGTWLVYLGTRTLWVPSVVLVLTLTLASYGLHRYETVVRKVVNEADSETMNEGETGAEAPR